MPEGPERIPIAVARPLSLSPNQFVASFETGFFKKAWPLKLIICPKNIGQNEPTRANILIPFPISIIIDPIITQYLSPWCSMTLVEIKLAGRYSNKSAYFAIWSRIGVASSYILSIIGLFVLIDAYITPVAADVIRYENRTIHRYLYRIIAAFSSPFSFTSIS